MVGRAATIPTSSTTNSTSERNRTEIASAATPIGLEAVTTKAEIVAHVKEHRTEIHQRVAAFLSPEQLSKWDSEVAKAKEFLGQRLDS